MLKNGAAGIKNLTGEYQSFKGALTDETKNRKISPASTIRLSA
jgi:hypothetical protein